MLPTSLLLSLLFAIPVATTQVPLLYHPETDLKFHLRQLHAVTNDSRIVFSDVPSGSAQNFVNDAQDSYTLSTRSIKTHRPSSFASHARARLKAFTREGESEVEELSWSESEVTGPDVTNRQTLLHLAKMTNNAYAYPDNGDDRTWYDLGHDWNISFPFGWEEDEDGFRGHVFTTSDESTVVISIKGTSAGLFGGGGPTAKKDRLNDNLLFSCCCARVDFTWSTVCGCYAGGSKCDRNCLEASLAEDSLFYSIGTNLYNNVSYMYPDATIWLIGHSLGGALASLLGVTFGAPVVTFEAPGEKMAAQRLHLPSPPSTQHVTHVYHTADPIPMGTCNGVISTCAIAGYAMESRCHMGESIVYDTVTKWRWGVDVRTHPIKVIVEQLLSVDWDKPPSILNGNETEGNAVPSAKPEEDCVVSKGLLPCEYSRLRLASLFTQECYTWEYGNFLDPSNW
ncbi:alpha/beta-hydrolase [Ramaria rubella]|nr:alpha/beta-hydrolase [Ramaria rubella]